MENEQSLVLAWLMLHGESGRFRELGFCTLIAADSFDLNWRPPSGASTSGVRTKAGPVFLCVGPVEAPGPSLDFCGAC